MADFQTRVDALTGLTSGTDYTTAELTEYLQDGVIEVTNRVIALRPQDRIHFQAESAEQTSNNSFSIKGDIVSVVREAEVNDDWRECRLISPSMQSRVTDKNSLDYASSYNPAYTLLDNGKISVFPAPGSTTKAFKVYYINTDPKRDSDAATLAHDSEDIRFFPKDKVYLVVLYAGIKCLGNALAAMDIGKGTNITAVSVPVFTLEAMPSISDLSISAIIPVKPSVDLNTIATFDTAPTYTQPVLSLTAAPTINDLAISSTVPVKPSVDLNTLGALSSNTAPTYTSPVMSLDTKPTISDLSISYTIPVAPALSSVTVTETDITEPTFTTPVLNAPNWSDTDNWITTEEDPEMLDSRIKTINAQISEYTAKVQEANLEFQKNNSILQKDIQVAIQNATFENNEDAEKLQKYQIELTAYTAQVTKDVQEYQQNFTKEVQIWTNNNTAKLSEYQSNLQNELNVFNQENVIYQAQLQEDIQNAQLAESEEARKLQAYGQEVQLYASKVSTEVQEYQANFTKELQLWQTKRQTEIQKYQTDIQNNLNTFTANSVSYQADIQKKLKEGDLAESEEARKIQLYGQDLQSYTAKVTKEVQEYQQNFTKEFQLWSKNNELGLAKYQANLQSYQGQVQEEIQTATIRLNEYRADYEWMNSRYRSLQQEYNVAFQIMQGKMPSPAPRTQPANRQRGQQGQRRRRR